MGTTTLLELDTALMKSFGPFRRHPVTTAINGDNLVVSTHLQNYRSSADFFNNWWLFLEDKANAGISRQISDDNGTTTLTVRGTALSDDSANLATFRISPYSWEQRTDAIIQAIDEIYPTLYRDLDIMTLVTGNILPNSHFLNWDSTNVAHKWASANATVTQEDGTSNTRGGEQSAIKVVATSANGYLTRTNEGYQHLLDLQGQTVSFRAWARPEVTDDVSLIIITVQTDGTTQTLTSTTSAPAHKWSLLKLDNQTLNDNLHSIEVKLNVATDTKYAYFDDARLFGWNPFEYLLPTNFDRGSISEVWVQRADGSGGASNDASDTLQPRHWTKITGWHIVDDGTDRFLRMPRLFPEGRRIRLIGTAPFEELVATSQTGTITLDGRRLSLLAALAKYKLFAIVPDLPASEDVARFDALAAKALFDYRRLSHLAMSQKSRSMNLPAIGSGV